MNTPISTKLAALAAALMTNSLLIVGVAYLFNGSLYPPVALAVTTQAMSSIGVA